jgi:predicted GNAT family N-acyltransferase
LSPLLTLKTPDQCTAIELDIFCELAASGGQLQDGLRQRLTNIGLILLFIAVDDAVAAVGALKSPNKKYQADIFKKAATPLAPKDFPVELGWCCVSPKYRGQGLSRTVVNALVTHSNEREQNVYATTRNDIMKHILTDIGFQSSGQPYTTETTNNPLQLFIHYAVPCI